MALAERLVNLLSLLLSLLLLLAAWL